MSVDEALWHSAERFLALEALYLDDKNWDAWLALYDEKAEFWVPAWADDGTPTRDPDAEISLVHYSSRAGLEDRVQRVRSGRSAAANLETRTNHSFKVLTVETVEGDRLQVRSNWQVYAYVAKQERVVFGSADYLLGGTPQAWTIFRKRTLLLNDVADTVIDFYLM